MTQDRITNWPQRSYERQMHRAADYCRFLVSTGQGGTEFWRDSDGWAKYYAGLLISGPCDRCGLSGGAHDGRCANRSQLERAQ